MCIMAAVIFTSLWITFLGINTIYTCDICKAFLNLTHFYFEWVLPLQITFYLEPLCTQKVADNFSLLLIGFLILLYTVIDSPLRCLYIIKMNKVHNQLVPAAIRYENPLKLTGLALRACLGVRLLLESTFFGSALHLCSPRFFSTLNGIVS